MTLRRLLRRALRVRPGEDLRVGLMLLFSVAAVGGVVITGQLVSRALFLGRLTQADIPFKFILPELALMAVAAAYGRVADRLRRDRLIVATCLGAAAGVVALWGLLSSSVGDRFATLCGLYVYTDVVGALVVLQFWTFAGDLFDPREARRLFAVIAGGSTLSNLLFGFGLSRAAAAVPAAQLLLVVVASLVVCAGCAAVLGHRCGDLLEGVHRPRGRREPVAVAQIARHPLVRTLAGLVVVVAAVSGIADYQLDLALRAEFAGDSAGMLGFLGRFRFWAGAGAFALQVLVAGRLVDRFGIVAALSLLPVAVASGGAAILATGGVLWASAIPRAADVVLKYTVHDTAVNLLYLPVGDRMRARAKALLDGVVKPPMAAAVGFLFLAIGPGTAPRDWVPPLAALVVGWLLLLLRARGEYVAALARSLQLRRLDLDRVRIDLSDAGSVRVVRAALASADPMRVTHALSWLEQMESVDWSADVIPLAAHPSPEVRRGAIAHLDRRGGEAVLPVLHAALADVDGPVRVQAIDALCRRGQEGSLRAFVADADAGVRGAVVRCLLRRDAAEGFARLRALAAAEDPATRRTAAALVAELGPSGDSLLTRLLADPSEEVVAAALRVAARRSRPPSLERLDAYFAVPRLRPAAVEVAAAWVASQPAAVAARVDAPDTPSAARLGLVAAFARAPVADVGPILGRWLQADDADLRTAALEAAVARRDRAGHSPVARDLVERQLAVEVRHAADWIAARRDTAAAADPLLADAVTRRLDQARARILLALDLLSGEIPHRRVAESLASGDRRLVAAALELVEQVLPRPLAEALAVLDPAAPTTADGAARIGPRLQALAAAPDPWLAECARRAARRLADDNDPGAVTMPLSVIEKVFFLKSVSLFQPLSGEEVAQIAAIVDEVEFAAGETFIRRGEEGDCLYILVEGQVVVALDGGRARTLSSREVIGELAVLGQRPRSADCRAVTDVVALRIDKDSFWQLLDERPGIAIEVMKVLVARYVPRDG